MRRRIGSVVLVTLAASVWLTAQDTIRDLKLTDGSDKVNEIGAPVFETSNVAPLQIEPIVSAYDRRQKIVRRTGGMMPSTRGPEYNLDPKIDLAALLTESLRAQATAMGFRSAAAEPGWQIRSTLKDIYLESRQVWGGATLFYGFLDVEFQVQRVDGESRTDRLRAHLYHGAYNAGTRRRDEAQEALGHLLVEGAQEFLARLNRTTFKAPPHPDIEKKVAAIRSPEGNALHVIGLSGSSQAVPVLLKLLPQVDDEDLRTPIINALGRLGSEEAVPTLASRYQDEDEDCRWSTLKAMDYIGGEAALAVVREKGTRDGYDPAKRLARRITGN